MSTGNAHKEGWTGYQCRRGRPRPCKSGMQIRGQTGRSPVFCNQEINAGPADWFSLDGNYWFGGKTASNGVENPLTQQKSSRIGVTASIPVSKNQSLKLSYNNGAYIRYGGNYQNVSVAWQYSWLGRPK